jgi:uncharacterized protein (DUF885 family)
MALAYHIPMSRKSIVLCCLGAVLAALALVLVNALFFRPWSIRVFFEREFIRQALDRPEELSMVRLLEPWGIRAHNAKWNDRSLAFEAREVAHQRETLATLERYDRNALSSADRVSYDTLHWQLSNAIEGERFRHHNYPVNQLFGFQNNLPSFLANIHQVNDERDAEDYLTRLDGVFEAFVQVREGLAAREAAGIIPPRFIIDRVLEEMRGFIAVPPEENLLYASFATKLSAAKSIEAGARERLLAKAKERIEKKVYPAYRGYIDYFAALRAKATDDAGVWKLPDGDAYYAWVLREQTTTGYTPADLHALGLKEVARIEAEMLAILHREGYGGTKAGPLMARLARESRFRYDEAPGVRESILKDYARMLSEAEARMSSAFSDLPKARIEVRRVPEFKEKTAAGAYYEDAAEDGSRPGVFYANLRDLGATQKFGMRTLAHHEGIPGHHFQIASQREAQGLPLFRRFGYFDAYLEGWALYAERLAWELGLTEDPYDNLGRLQAELFRAARLVTDTGLHYRRWTREQAIDYLEGVTGMAHSDVVSEVERYIVDPGQACAYKVGMIKILELRERARSALGKRFDLKAFHHLVLSNGALPLGVLEELVNDYLHKAAA